MKKIEEVVYHRVHIFLGDKNTIVTINPGLYNRKYYKLVGKVFVEALKELSCDPQTLHKL